MLEGTSVAGPVHSVNATIRDVDIAGELHVRGGGTTEFTKFTPGPANVVSGDVFLTDDSELAGSVDVTGTLRSTGGRLRNVTVSGPLDLLAGETRLLGTTRVTGAIAGGGDLRIGGPSVVVSDLTSSFTGDLTIDAGRLTLSGDYAGDVAVACGAILAVPSGQTFAGSVTLDGGSLHNFGRVEGEVRSVGLMPGRLGGTNFQPGGILAGPVTGDDLRTFSQTVFQGGLNLTGDLVSDAPALTVQSPGHIDGTLRLRGVPTTFFSTSITAPLTVGDAELIAQTTHIGTGGSLTVARRLDLIGGTLTGLVDADDFHTRGSIDQVAGAAARLSLGPDFDGTVHHDAGLLVLERCFAPGRGHAAGGPRRVGAVPEQPGPRERLDR